MVIIRGSGSGVGNPERTGPDEEICDIITAEVAMEIWEAISEMLGSIKTILI